MQAEADMNRFRRKDVLADGLLNGLAAPETVKTHTRMRFGKCFILMIVLVFVALVGMAGAYADIVMYDDFESPVAKGIIDASTPFAALQYGETFGSVYREGGEYYLFTSYSSGVYVRNSTDGATWGASKAVLSHGTINAWDSSKIYCPIVWKEGRTYYMIYGGYDSTGVTKVGLATSANVEGPYEKDPANPVYDNAYPSNWSYRGAEPWGIQKINETYYLWVNNFGGTGTPPNGTGERQLGLVTSRDLRHWTPDPANPIFIGQRFCPFPFKIGDTYYLIVTHQYQGSNYAVLELYRCQDPRFYPDERQFLGIIMSTPRDSLTGYGGDLDTPALISTDLSFDVIDDPIPIYYSVASQWDIWKMGKFHLSQSALSDGKLFPDSYKHSSHYLYEFPFNYSYYSTFEPQTAFSLSTDTARDGSHALKIAVTPSNEYYRVFINRAVANVGFWVKETDASRLILYGYSDRDDESLNFQLCSNGKIQYRDGLILNSGSYVRSNNEWYRIDISFDITANTWGYQLRDVSGTVLENTTNLALTSQPSQIAALVFYRTYSPHGTLYLDSLEVSSPP
jgi:hypothetical protein